MAKKAAATKFFTGKPPSLPPPREKEAALKIEARFRLLISSLFLSQALSGTYSARERVHPICFQISCTQKRNVPKQT